MKKPVKKQTSSKISNIASRILNDGKFSIAELKSLAASALSQDETKSGGKK